MTRGQEAGDKTGMDQPDDSPLAIGLYAAQLVEQFDLAKKSRTRPIDAIDDFVTMKGKDYDRLIRDLRFLVEQAGK
jgi:hypothetical protein